MSDPEGLDALERRLAAVDFSADSRVRAGLRARLLRRRAPPRPRPGAARVLVLAACLLAVLTPALRRALRTPEGAFSYPRGEEGLPVLPGRFDFAAARAVAPVFEVARGREIPLKDGKAVEWELSGASFRLETRRIAPEDIFDKPRMRGEL